MGRKEIGIEENSSWNVVAFLVQVAESWVIICIEEWHKQLYALERWLWLYRERITEGGTGGKETDQHLL